MIQFILGFILFAVGVGISLHFSSELVEPEKVKNLIIGGVAGVVIGAILTIWGFIVGTTPKA